jgi:hypothetical protein
VTTSDVVDTAPTDCTAASPPVDERPYSRDEFVAWLTASCQRQHVPVTISDPATIAHVATLLGRRGVRTELHEVKDKPRGLSLRRSAQVLAPPR